MKKLGNNELQNVSHEGTIKKEEEEEEFCDVTKAISIHVKKMYSESGLAR